MKKLKVLSIGNSFSVDGMEYLYDIAKSYGIEEIILGNLYIGGCSIEMHIEQIQQGLSDYIYFKNTKGIWEETHHVNAMHGILDESWDMITLQQVSHQSGLLESYNHQLDELITFVNKHKTNKQAKLAWHMTWAYQADSTHGGFSYYDNNQLKMYHAITTCVKEKIQTDSRFSYIIPSGTVIQNMRTVLGDTLTRDGFHLSFDLGRFFASMCWFKTLTGFDVKKVTYRPTFITQELLSNTIAAVNAAYIKPFEITNLERKI